MAPEPTPTDYAFLVLLNVAGGEISNTDMNKRFGVRLIGADYRQMNALGWADSETKHRPYRHTMTPGGRAALAKAFVDATDDAALTAKEKSLWAALKALHDDGVKPQDNGVRPQQPREVEQPRDLDQPRDLEQRIRDAYAKLAPGPGEWVSLSRLRRELGDAQKGDVDRALKSLHGARDVNLEPEANQKRLSPEVRHAAVRIGGEDRHLLAIGMR